MKFFLHFSLQIKNIVLILHRQKQTMGYGVMVTLQILVLSFLVRIQVAQLKRSSQEGRFFCFIRVARDVRSEHVAMLGECNNASIVQKVNSIFVSNTLN